MHGRRVAIVGIFGALSFLLTFIEFPIIPLLPFLKFDPSDSLIILVTMGYGFLPGFFTLIIKSFLFIFRAGDGGLIGILMNFIAGTAFITTLYLLKNFVKLNNWINYVISSLLTGVVAYGLNYFIAIPVYTNQPTSQFVSNIGISLQVFFLLVLLFNFIKFFVDSSISHFLLKKTKITSFAQAKREEWGGFWNEF